MAADQPIVVYHHDDDKPKHTKKKMDDFYEKWLAKKKGKSAVGEKISLSGYLRNK